MPGLRTVIGLVFVFLNLGGLAHADLESESRLQLEPEAKLTSSRKWSGEWSILAGGEGYGEGRDEGVAAFTFLRTKFDYRFTDMLQLHAEPRLDFFTSRLQQHFETDDYRSKIKLGYAFLALKPVEMVELDGGAISQEYLNSVMLVSRHRSFLGLQEQLKKSFEVGHGTVKTAIVAEQTVPASYSLDTEREDKEPLPTFQTQDLQFSGKIRNDVAWNAIGGHYTWSDIPDTIAFQSANLGNSTVNNVVAPGSKLKYGFDGLFLSSELCFCQLVSWGGIGMEFQRLHNGRADDGYGDAQMWGIGPHLILGDVTLDARYRSFFIEKDATVAWYMTGYVGNTNRMGDDVEFKLDFKKHGFAVVGEWANAVPMRSNDLQNTLTWIALGVESHYAPF